jgi:fibro-slime domain-containing protein
MLASLMAFGLFACSDYGLSDPTSPVSPPRTPTDTGAAAANPPGTVEETEQDTGVEGVEVTDDDTGGGLPPIPDPYDDCEDGYWADYYNLPWDHPDVERAETGLMPGDHPDNHDWWDAGYFVRREVDPGLEFGDDWWPVDEGEPGDPQYFAVHWQATLVVDDSEGWVMFELGSDDDGWAFLDGEMIADLGGIHGVTTTTYAAPAKPGEHKLELFMAERHTSNAGFWFKFLSENVRVYACPE